MEKDIGNVNPRVMHVVPSLENGGLQRAVLDLVDNVPDVEMSVAAINSGGDYQSDFEKRCPTIVIGNEDGDPHRTYTWFRPGPILRLAREMKALQPNIVQTHTFGAATVGRAAAKLAGIPVVIDTLHNTYTWKDSHVLRIDRFLERWTDKIVCVSGAVMDYSIQQNPAIPVSKYTVIHNGVDINRFHPRRNRTELHERFGIAEGELVVGSVSRLVKQKRTKDLVAAAPDILNKHPTTRFLIAGEGPTSTELKEQVRTLGLMDRFIFSGTLDDTQNIYPTLDVFAQTAEREGFGLSLAEAMASGTAVVAANTGAIPELVREGENGLLYGVGEVSALANAINELLANKGKRDEIGKQAAYDIATNFNMSSVPDKYRQLWYSLLQNSIRG